MHIHLVELQRELISDFKELISFLTKANSDCCKLSLKTAEVQEEEEATASIFKVATAKRLARTPQEWRFYQSWMAFSH